MSTSTAIHGLPHQSKCLAALHGESSGHRFLAGTCTSHENNEISLLAFDDDKSRVSCEHIFSHPHEVWRIVPHPQLAGHMLTVYRNGKSFAASLWEAPSLRSYTTAEPPAGYPSADASSAGPDDLIHLCRVGSDADFGSRLLDLAWDPMGLYNTVVTLEENGIAAWAVDGSQNCKLKKRKSFADSGRLRAIDWDPHGSEFVAVAAEQSVFGFDFRADTISYSLKGVSRSGLSTLKFNPARQHVLALGHLDGTISFYDVRNAAKPLMQLHGHSHWVTQIAFNTFHDSYVLTAGTDAILNLWRLHSVSAEYEREKEKEKEKEKEREKEGGIERTPSKRALMAEREREKDKDFLVRRGTEHENPVCSVAWSTHSPWCWASMSTDGRILFHKMPQEERSRSFA